MKKRTTILVLVICILSFAAGYYTAFKIEVPTDDQMKKVFDDYVAELFINQFYQHEVYTTYQVAKTLQSIREGNTATQDDIDKLELIIKDNQELFELLYRDHPVGKVLQEQIAKQEEFIKSYRAKYMNEKP